jgi:hypothetical protein
VEIIHVPTPEELRRGLDQLMKDLALRYQPVALRPIALPPGQPWALDDKKIIHANCSTKIYRKRTVDLAEDVTVTLLFPQAVAASALRQVIIPYIKHTVKVCDPALVSQRWYVPVMKDGWHVIRTNNPHVLKYHASRDLTVKQVERGDFLRNQWHQFYLEHGIA